MGMEMTLRQLIQPYLFLCDLISILKINQLFPAQYLMPITMMLLSPAIWGGLKLRVQILVRSDKHPRGMNRHPSTMKQQCTMEGNPEAIVISAERLNTLLHNGSNTFAIEVHNRSLSSSDFSSIFYFTVGITVSGKYYKNPPEWFYPPFQSSNLPLMLINTNGQSFNLDERIIAEIGLMDYTDFGKRNYLTDTFNIYEGKDLYSYPGFFLSDVPKKELHF